ncbi:MAG: outer membrane beta-barrel protein, partial [Flavisolibacter sp.]
MCLKKPRRSQILLFSLLILGALDLQAQKNGARISGQVFSDSLKQELAGATVLLSNARDSSVEKIILTDHRGKFVFSSVQPDSFILVITEVNHETLVRSLLIGNDQHELSLDSIFLHVKTNDLDPITIFSRKIPVLIKPDTIEFNASSFPTRPNDMVEELLKKLPGVEVDRDGNITAQGEKITQILVDGKPFFGSDPRTASQNLPADLIEKVQVIDQRSERSRITRVNDGETQKVINLTIRKDRNKGSFGRAYAGYGTQNHYEASVNANHFEGDKKIALIASQNNTGRTDYSSGSNDLAVSAGNSNGINTNSQLRMNYTNKWGKKLTVATDIGYNNTDNISDQVRNRQTVLGDSVIYYFEQTSANRTRSGINGNINLNYEADSLTRIIFTQSMNYSRYNSHALSAFLTSETGRKVNEGTRANDNASKSPLWNGNLSFSRSFRKMGRALFVNLSDNINKSNSEGFIHSANYFYPLSEPDYSRLLDQYLPANNSNNGWNAAATFNEPLSTKSSLGLNLTYNYSKGHSLRETFDWNPVSQRHDIFNDTLSSHFNNFSSFIAAGFNYNQIFGKGNISIGANWQDNRIKTVSVFNDSIYQQQYASILPFASYNYSSKGKRFSLNYNYGTRAPQPIQLQKIIDNTNP